MNFNQLPAAKKGLKNGTSQQTFGPSYFDRALVDANKVITIEVAQGNIFMEQKMRFGLVLGSLAVLKKKLGADSEQLLRVFFSCFQGQKDNSKKILRV